MRTKKINIYAIDKHKEHHYLCSSDVSNKITCTKVLANFIDSNLNMHVHLNLIKSIKRNRLKFIGQCTVFSIKQVVTIYTSFK